MPTALAWCVLNLMPSSHTMCWRSKRCSGFTIVVANGLKLPVTTLLSGCIVVTANHDAGMFMGFATNNAEQVQVVHKE